MENKPKKNQVIAFFASVRLSIFLLLTLAATSIIGTLIPQGGSVGEYKKMYGDFFYQLFDFLNFFDMYRSRWFQLILLMLAINLLVCSFKRFPKTWKLVAKAKPGFRQAKFNAIKIKYDFEIKKNSSRAADIAKQVISKKFRFYRTGQDGEDFTLYAEKGRWTRLGVYMVHGAFICILLGAVIGSIWGFSGYAHILEGEAADRVELKTNKETALPFVIQCDNFSIDYYKNGSIKEYRSMVTILEPGKEPWRTSIIVNHPLRFRGINIFQSSYGVSSYSGTVNLVFYDSVDQKKYPVTVSLMQMSSLPGNRGKFMIAGYRENFHAHGRDIGPAVRIHLFPDKEKPTSLMVPVGFPDFSLEKCGFGISVAGQDLSPVYYTSLKVTKDPGVWVVYAGFLLIIAGCIITFFMSHRQLYIKISSIPGGARVQIAGAANKNRHGFEERVRRIAGLLENRE